MNWSVLVAFRNISRQLEREEGVSESTVGMVLLAVVIAVALVIMVVRILTVDLVVMVTVAVVTIVEGCAVIAVSNSV